MTTLDLTDLLKSGREFTYGGERFLIWEDCAKRERLMSLSRKDSHETWKTLAYVARPAMGSQTFRFWHLDENGEFAENRLGYDSRDEAMMALMSFPTSLLYQERFG